MNTFVLPLDGTSEAEVALTGLRALSARQPVTVHLLYVGEDAKGEHRAYLDKVGKLLTELGHAVHVTVRDGDPVDGIVWTASAVDADLVILKRDEREGVGGWVLGSITDNVAKDLACPLLLMNPLPGDSRWLNYSVHHILVALDGSARAEAGVERALELAAELGARVSAVYAVPWLQPTFVAAPEIAAVGAPSPQTDAELEAQMHSYLDGVVSRFADRVKLGTIAMRGDPVDAIVAAAENHDADLLVVTSRGAGGFLKRVLGSVADGCAKKSGVPVLLIWPREDS